MVASFFQKFLRGQPWFFSPQKFFTFALSLHFCIFGLLRTLFRHGCKKKNSAKNKQKKENKITCSFLHFWNGVCNTFQHLGQILFLHQKICFSSSVAMFFLTKFFPFFTFLTVSCNFETLPFSEEIFFFYIGSHVFSHKRFPLHFLPFQTISRLIFGQNFFLLFIGGCVFLHFFFCRTCFLMRGFDADSYALLSAWHERSSMEVSLVQSP